MKNSQKTVLITGASCCTGIHTARQCRSTWDCVIHGTSRGIRRGGDVDHWHALDIRDRATVTDLMKAVQPDIVFHFAASSDPSDYPGMVDANVSGTWKILDACRSLPHAVKVLLVGSAASFGEMNTGEDGLGALRSAVPASLYGLTRQTQMELGRILSDDQGVEVYLCRTFNLIGPFLSDSYAPAALTNRIREAARSGKDSLLIRSLQNVRDFIDVRDAVAAYIAILEQGRQGYPYSVGTGLPVTILELATTIAEACNIELKFLAQQEAGEEIRSGIQRSVADPKELKVDTNWDPGFSLAQSVNDMCLSLGSHFNTSVTSREVSE